MQFFVLCAVSWPLPENPTTGQSEGSDALRLADHVGVIESSSRMVRLIRISFMVRCEFLLWIRVEVLRYRRFGTKTRKPHLESTADAMKEVSDHVGNSHS